MTTQINQKPNPVIQYNNILIKLVCYLIAQLCKRLCTESDLYRLAINTEISETRPTKHNILEERRKQKITKLTNKD